MRFRVATLVTEVASKYIFSVSLRVCSSSALTIANPPIDFAILRHVCSAVARHKCRGIRSPGNTCRNADVKFFERFQVRALVNPKKRDNPLGLCRGRECRGIEDESPQLPCETLSFEGGCNQEGGGG